MAASRGRGFARGANDSPNALILRRPGEAGMLQRFGSSMPTETAKGTVDSQVNDICAKMLQMDFSTKIDFTPLTDQIKTACHSVQDLEKCIDAVFTFGLKSKWNAHVTAMFCNAIGDITISEAKFRTNLLRKLQAAYKERNKKYMELDSFMMDVTFLCEIYHHVRIEGMCLKVLSRPIIDYFGMLVDGTSQKEVEVFVEQFPKCYHNLKENDQAGLEILLCKLRKQIICEPSNVVVRAMLIEIFENILTDFEPLSQSAKNLYESLSKPLVRFCE